MKIAKTLPSQGIGVYCQDKSSRICFASLEKTNAKVEEVLSDTDKYKKLSSDHAVPYQAVIRSWYSSSKSCLKSIEDDISSFLTPQNVSTPTLKVMVKTHKSGCPVRLTFSSVGSTTSNLSSALDHAYLKPTVTSGLCKRRLGDTRDALKFIENINNFLWENNIEDRPTIFSMDIQNFFPSVNFDLAIPAITKFLKMRGLPAQEIKAVTEGLKIVRNGNFFRWKEQFYNQISGCALGDPDSCSYCDLGIAHLLDDMIPACERQLSVQLDPFFKAYRDYGLGLVFCDPSVIPLILSFLNSYNDSIQWTIPACKSCDLPEATCSHYHQLEFLDVLITWKQVPKNGSLIWQFQTRNYSKATDVHAYLHPTSCSSPHLNSKGVSVAKTVGTRLRTIHSNDSALLQDLNLFSGYLLARGYQETSIKYHLANMANRSREFLLEGGYHQASTFKLPMVTTLHPATTVLTRFTKSSFKAASQLDPMLEYLFPSKDVVVAYRKLPNLQLLMCRNDQNSLVSMPTTIRKAGYVDTGCKCRVCKASIFGNFVRSPALPGFLINLTSNTSCRSGPGVVYHITCTSKTPQCRLAHYVGRAWTNSSTVIPMAARWSNHKSYPKCGVNKCKLSDHLLKYYKGEDSQKFLKIQILDSATTLEETRRLELFWTRKLFAFFPTGLNDREENI